MKRFLLFFFLPALGLAAPILQSGWTTTTNASTARSALGLAIGTNVQAYDADLTTWAGVTPASGVGTALAIAPGASGGFLTNSTTTSGLALAFSPSGSGTVAVSPGGAVSLQGGGTITLAPTAGSAVNIQPTTGNVSIAPGGSGSITITSAGAGTMNNVAIGGSTPLPGAFTTLTGTSLTLSTPLAAASGGTGATFNVKAYGATGDARKVTDAVLNGTTTVTSATAAFTSADVGKVIWGIETASGNSRLPIGTVTAVGSATSITVSVAATGSYTGISLVLGTNDSDAIRSARVAAAAANPKGKIVLPSGGYIFSKLLFDLTENGADSIAIEGAGSAATILFPTPNFDFATTTSGKGMVTRCANPLNLRMSGFSVDGSKASLSGSGYSAIELTTSGSFISDVHVTNFKGLSNGMSTVGNTNLFEHVKVEACDYNGLTVNGSGVTFLESYAGNCGNYGLVVISINGASNTGYYFRWVGGTVDESTNAGCSVESSTDVSFIGAKLFGPSGPKPAVIVDGTSVARFTGCELVPFGSGNRGSLKVLSGGVAYLTTCRLASSGTGVPIDNAGTVYDAGGNVISAGTPSGTATVRAPLLAASTPQINSTGLTGNVAAATLYSVPATGEGLYRVSAYLVTTTAASVSSTMPNAQVVYRDKDSDTDVTLDVSPILGAAGLGQSGLLTANAVGTVFSGTVVIYVKASTTIQYQTVNYASTAAGMAYSLRMRLEPL